MAGLRRWSLACRRADRSTTSAPMDDADRTTSAVGENSAAAYRVFFFNFYWVSRRPLEMDSVRFHQLICSQLISFLFIVLLKTKSRSLGWYRHVLSESCYLVLPSFFFDAMDADRTTSIRGRELDSRLPSFFFLLGFTVHSKWIPSS